MKDVAPKSETETKDGSVSIDGVAVDSGLVPEERASTEECGDGQEKRSAGASTEESSATPEVTSRFTDDEKEGASASQIQSAPPSKTDPPGHNDVDRGCISHPDTMIVSENEQASQPEQILIADRGGVACPEMATSSALSPVSREESGRNQLTPGVNVSVSQEDDLRNSQSTIPAGTSQSTPGAFFVAGISSMPGVSAPTLRRQEAISNTLIGDSGPQAPPTIDAEATVPTTSITATLVADPLAVHAEEVRDPSEHVYTERDTENDRKTRERESEHTRMRIATIASIVVALVAIIVTAVVLSVRGRNSKNSEVLEPSTVTAYVATSTPTASPTSEIFSRETLMGIVSAISDEDSLQEESSPQYQSFDWLVKDQARIPLRDAARIVQRYVLAVIYFSTGGGEYWTSEYNFLSSSHECEWTDGASGVACSKNETVTSLDLFNNGLVGNIPAEVAALKSLLEFRMLGNANLTGSIPSELGLLSDLSFLSLVDNSLTGTIPNTIGNLKNLMGLWLHKNALTGTIPPELGHFPSMTWLWLHENMLTGSTPASFVNLTTATHIWLYGNELAGSVDFLCDALHNLEELSVDKSEVVCSCCNCCD